MNEYQKKRIKLFLEITYGMTWRIAVLLFAYMGFVNWWFDVVAQ